MMDHLLLVDEMIDLSNQSEKIVDIVRPGVEHFVGILMLLEINNASRTIDLCPDSAGSDQVCESLLGFGNVQAKMFRHPLEGDLGVILGHDANILLKKKRMKS